MGENIFKNRKLVIATKHHKEQVLAPLFEKQLGLICFAAPNFDTDALGTFTGEIERSTDPLTTARKKCLMAMDLNNCNLAIASEGSFGPHPTIPFIGADDEWLFFIDKQNNLEIYAREISTDTNFNAAIIKTQKELQAFAQQAGFPLHALILRKSGHESTDMEKGITDPMALNDIFTRLQQKYGEVYCETDMRALYNPTRMKVIEKAALQLLNKMKSCCPACDTPGFAIKDARLGLSCGLCRSPTKSVLSYLYRCNKCGYIKEDLYPNGRQVEDPRFCEVCNP